MEMEKILIVMVDPGLEISEKFQEIVGDMLKGMQLVIVVEEVMQIAKVIASIDTLKMVFIYSLYPSFSSAFIC